MKKKNCWEIMKCGMEQGGKNVAKLGVCPASVSNEYNGINNGKYTGKFY